MPSPRKPKGQSRRSSTANTQTAAISTVASVSAKIEPKSGETAKTGSVPPPDNISSEATTTKQQTITTDRPDGSYLHRMPGRRPLKEYPLTEGDMRELAGVGVIATLLFSLSSGLFGFWVNVSKDLAFAQGVPDKTIAFWEAARIFSLIAAIVLAGIGGLAIYYGQFRLSSIMRETEFDANSNH